MPEVVIYTRQFCSFCTMALRLLDEAGIAYVKHDATGKPEVRTEMIQRAHGAFTFPQVFVGDRHIGGCRELYHWQRQGGIERLLAGAKAMTA